MTRKEQIKILNKKVKANNAQYNIDRLNAEISAFSEGDLDKYEFFTGKYLKYKPNAPDKAKFEFSPLGRAFNQGLDKTVQGYQEEGVIKLLKDIRDGLKGGVNNRNNRNGGRNVGDNGDDNGNDDENDDGNDYGNDDRNNSGNDDGNDDENDDRNDDRDNSDVRENYENENYDNEDNDGNDYIDDNDEKNKEELHKLSKYLKNSEKFLKTFDDKCNKELQESEELEKSGELEKRL